MTNCSQYLSPMEIEPLKLLGSQTQVILAIDGLQPQVGHEVLWVIRDCRA